MPSEALCIVISSKFAIDYARVRISLDALCIAVSIILSLAGGFPLKIREGTIMGMFMLGPLEKISMNIFRPCIYRIKGFPKREYF